MTAFRFDHAVVFVPDLHAATVAYRGRGFAVRPGGRHQGSPTHNALIGFADGGYLELIAPVRRWIPPLLRTLRRLGALDAGLRLRPPLQRRFLRGFAAGGFRDFCLGVTALDEVVRDARGRGLRIHGPVSMGRVRADGERLQWRLALPADPHLPFLIEDVTPRTLRIPPAADGDGAIRVKGVEEIRITTRGAGELARRFGALLGGEAERGEGDGALFRIAGASVRIVERRDGVADRRRVLRLAVTGGAGGAAVRGEGDGLELVPSPQ